MEEFCGGKFWDLNLTWYTDDPDFTPCFQHSVLIWVPCIFLVAFSPFEFHLIKNSKYADIPWSFLNVSRLLITTALLGLTLCDFITANTLHGTDGVYDVHIVAPVIKLLTFFLAIIMSYWNKKSGIMSSGVPFMFWFLLGLFAIVQFRSEIKQYETPNDNISDDEKQWNKYRFASNMIYFPLVVLQFINHCFADKRPQISYHDPLTSSSSLLDGKKENPEITASFLNRILFVWFEPIIWKGYRRPLTADDISELSPREVSKELFPEFDRYWEQSIVNGQRKLDNQARKNGEKNINSRRTNGSVLPAIIKSFGGPFWLAGFLRLIVDLISFAPPFILGLLIEFASGDGPMWQGIFFMIILCAVSVLTSLLNGQYYQMTFMVGFRIRSALISSIYRKALTISSVAKKDTTVGEIVNLMAVDAMRFIESTQYGHTVWAGPLVIILAIYFLWQILGVAVVTGLVVLILMLPINGYFAALMRKCQMDQMKKKDERVKLMNEILNGMKVLKLYAWENSFGKFIEDIRTKELHIVRKMAFLNAITYITWTISPFLVTLLSFATYVLMDENNRIDASTAFVSLTLFNIIRMPLISTPMTIASLLQTWVAITRINKYLNGENIDETNITHNKDDGKAINIKDASFSWGDDGESALKNINLILETGSLSAVVGTVGSGKSTLVSSILGETEKTSGTINTYGSIAYVAQQAWIQNSTLKNNILFGKPFDQKLYDRVLDACALLPDIQMLPAGDQTEIGEKGINLSGGQKQRVSLARAVYNQADIYLLDDPLSAVDSHVGRHIFDNVIGPNGMLAGKTILLVTHGLTYLPHVATIHVMTNGEITESGPYTRLISEKGAFANFIEQYLQEIAGDEEEIQELQLVLDENTEVAKIFKRTISSISKEKVDTPTTPGTPKRLSRQESKIKLPAISEDDGTLMQKEESQVGRVNIGVYIRYFKSIGVMACTIAIVTSITNQVFSIWSNIWLADWSADENSNDPDVRDLYLGVYGVMGVLQAISVFGTALALAIGCVYASRDIHSNLLKQTLRLPMSFFDTTPLGRIINKFSKDIDVIDILIPMMIRFGLLMFFSVLAVLVVISISTPIFLAVIFPISIIYYFVHVFYIAASRQLKRIESVTRSPVYSHFGETIAGQSTIRAYRAQDRFILESDNRVDFNQKCTLPSGVVSNRWLSVRLELIGTLVILFAVLFALLGKDLLTGATVGLSISYALQVTSLLNWLVMMAAEVETNIVANERLEEYDHLEKEAALVTKPVDPAWPVNGQVIFKNYQLRYRANLDLVLKGITFSVNGGEKVGIVGRTGAGKSSLTLALFRIIEAAGGSIIIDGLDISELGLHSLRSRLTIIPQDPVLFSGNLRMNIDPLEVYSDDEIWTALEHAHLKVFVKSTPHALQHPISEGGENLSVGQRQLVCLARALLRKTKILILDEATAAVDLETDDLIQKTIRSQFKECTILTIAHRLNTIMDSDKVLVLDQGNVAEYDLPKKLLEDKNSMFYSMAKDAGIITGNGNNAD